MYNKFDEKQELYKNSPIKTSSDFNRKSIDDWNNRIITKEQPFSNNGNSDSCIKIDIRNSKQSFIKEMKMNNHNNRTIDNISIIDEDNQSLESSKSQAQGKFIFLTSNYIFILYYLRIYLFLIFIIFIL
jgi:hypothetical protein